MKKRSQSYGACSKYEQLETVVVAEEKPLVVTPIIIKKTFIGKNLFSKF